MKKMSLRGRIEYADNARSLNNKIFEFESNDLSIAWLVKKFVMWPIGIRANIASTEGQMMFAAALATDQGNYTINTMCDPSDNRLIAWVQRGFNVRDEGVDDFIAAPTGLEACVGYVDPNHLINDALYIHSANTKDGGTNPNRQWAYVVELEQVKISETQAILQIVKNRAQDIDN